MYIFSRFVASTDLPNLRGDEGARPAPRHLHDDPGHLSERVSHVWLQECHHSEEKAECTRQEEGGAGS